MSVAQARLPDLLETAVRCGCAGIELRNDLADPLFGGLGAVRAGALIRERGLALFALAEVPAFNCCNAQMLARAGALIELAATCGAQGVCLIPANNGAVQSRSERLDMLRESLEALLPLLQKADVTGLVEPLGFETASLRYKAEAVEVINELDAASHVKIIHDTFHHNLAGEQVFFAQHTALVHVSGVTDVSEPIAQLSDAHRGLVDSRDRLQNMGQIKSLLQAGYTGPMSMEAFSPEVHQMTDPATKLAESFRYIADQLDASAA